MATVEEVVSVCLLISTTQCALQFLTLPVEYDAILFRMPFNRRICEGRCDSLERQDAEFGSI